jgi:hypothetical protein
VISAEVTLEGADVDIAAALTAAALEGLKDGGEHVLKLARDIVPIEEGTLERSGRVTDDGRGTVAVSFDTPYAVTVHEMTNLRHASGRKAKYLETALADGASDVGRLVAAKAHGATA